MSGCKNETNVSDRKLSITRLGFVADYEHPVTPGSEVEIFAYANKNKGIEYKWNLEGEWNVISPNRIKWTVPQESGEYEVSVEARDPNTGDTAMDIVPITVLDEAVLASPLNFSCKIKTKTCLANRFIGNIEDTSTTHVTKRKDGSMHIESENSSGELTQTIGDGENIYNVDGEGNKSNIMRLDDFSNTARVMTPTLLSLASLMNFTDDYVRNGRMYSFRQKSGEKSYKIDFDSLLGQVTRIRSENDDRTQVSEMSISYDVKEGFLVPRKVTGIVTYVIADVEYRAFVEQEFTDVKINFEEDE